MWKLCAETLFLDTYALTGLCFGDLLSIQFFLSTDYPACTSYYTNTVLYNQLAVFEHISDSLQTDINYCLHFIPTQSQTDFQAVCLLSNLSEANNNELWWSKESVAE